MKYNAIITIGVDLAKAFEKIEEAEQWLDSMNDDLKYASVIQELDDHGHVIDSFNYTER